MTRGLFVLLLACAGAARADPADWGPSTLVANWASNNARGEILANGSSYVRANNFPAP